MDLYLGLKKISSIFWVAFFKLLLIFLLVIVFTFITINLLKKSNQVLINSSYTPQSIYKLNINSDPYIDSLVYSTILFTKNSRIDKSLVLKDILTNFSSLENIELINNCNNLYELATLLNLYGEHNLEYNILSYYANKYLVPEITKENGRDATLDFLNYLERTYYKKIYYAVLNSNYYEAKWLSDMAFRRLRLIDTKPLDNMYDSDWIRLNRITLTACVLRNPDFFYIYKNELNFFLESLWSNFQNKSNKELDSNYFLPNELEIIKLYLKSIYLFRKKKYFETLINLNKCCNNKDNYYLYQSSLLLKARTLFWIFDQYRNDSTYFAFSKQAKRLKSEIEIKSYKTDIDHYIEFADEIRNPNLKLTNKINKLAEESNLNTIDSKYYNSFFEIFKEMDKKEMELLLDALKLIYETREDSNNW
jgi:hypothetical protein